jgi:hypothetical protein
VINYVTKLKLEAAIELVIPFIVVVLIVVVILLFLPADAAALDSIVTDVARRLSLLVMTLRRRRGMGTVVTVVAFLA